MPGETAGYPLQRGLRQRCRVAFRKGKKNKRKRSCGCVFCASGSSQVSPKAQGEVTDAVGSLLGKQGPSLPHTQTLARSRGEQSPTRGAAAPALAQRLAPLGLSLALRTGGTAPGATGLPCALGRVPGPAPGIGAARCWLTLSPPADTGACREEESSGGQPPGVSVAGA